MKKINIFLIIVVSVALIVGGFSIFPNQVKEFFFRAEISAPQKNTEEKVALIIDDDNGSPQTFEVGFEQGMTAFSLLKKKTEETNVPLETKTYDAGIFISAIGSKKNGQDEKYWTYYVNDELPMIAADKYEIKPGDKVEFRFGKSPF